MHCHITGDDAGHAPFEQLARTIKLAIIYPLVAVAESESALGEYRDFQRKHLSAEQIRHFSALAQVEHRQAMARLLCEVLSHEQLQQLVASELVQAIIGS